MCCGTGEIWVDRTTRTNEAGIEAIRKIVEPYGYQIRPVDVAEALHLKTAITFAAPSLAVLNSAWIDHSAFRDYELLDVHPEEPFAGNTLRLAETTILPSDHARTAERIAKHTEVAMTPINEVAKAEAGLTCLSIVVPARQQGAV